MILARLSRILRRPMPTAAIVDAEANAIIADISGLRPALAGGLVEVFAAKITSERLTGTVERLADIAEAPAAAARYFEDRGLEGPLTISTDPLLGGLDWGEIVTTRSIEAHRGAALGVARLAIAETGSLVMASSTDSPSLHNFLPLHHLVVVPVNRIRPYLEDAFLEIEPRAHRLVSLITGTSGTADIEGRNVRGAHGPRFLHVMLVG